MGGSFEWHSEPSANKNISSKKKKKKSWLETITILPFLSLVIETKIRIKITSACWLHLKKQ